MTPDKKKYNLNTYVINIIYLYFGKNLYLVFNLRKRMWIKLCIILGVILILKPFFYQKID